MRIRICILDCSYSDFSYLVTGRLWHLIYVTANACLRSQNQREHASHPAAYVSYPTQLILTLLHIAVSFAVSSISIMKLQLYELPSIKADFPKSNQYLHAHFELTSLEAIKTLMLHSFEEFLAELLAELAYSFLSLRPCEHTCGIFAISSLQRAFHRAIVSPAVDHISHL